MQKKEECPRAEGKCKTRYCEDENNPIVEDAENVLRIFLHPEHYNICTKKIEPAAFTYRELVEIGCSVSRVKLITSIEAYKGYIEAFVEFRRSKDKDNAVELACICQLSVAQVRSLHEALFFCPSGRKTNRAHADIHCIKLAPAEMNDVRDMLAKVCVLGELDDFFKGEIAGQQI